MDLQKFIDKAVEILKKDGYHSTILLLQSEILESIIPLQVVYNNREQKMDFFNNVLPRFISAYEISEFVFITESWYYQADKESKEFILPSEHPERKESLNLLHVTRDTTVGVHIPFERKGNTIITGEPKVEKDIEPFYIIPCDICN